MVLPWPTVTGNNAYRRGKWGGMYMAKEAKEWKGAAIDAVKVHVHEARVAVPPDGGLLLTLSVYPPNKRRRDLDNLVKLTQDALFEAIGLDDNLTRLRELRVRRKAGRHPATGQGAITVRLHPDPGDDDDETEKEHARGTGLTP